MVWRSVGTHSSQQNQSDPKGVPLNHHPADSMWRKSVGTCPIHFRPTRCGFARTSSYCGEITSLDRGPALEIGSEEAKKQTIRSTSTARHMKWTCLSRIGLHGSLFQSWIPTRGRTKSSNSSATCAQARIVTGGNGTYDGAHRGPPCCWQVAWAAGCASAGCVQQMVGDQPPTAHVKNSHKPVWYPRDYTSCSLLKCGGDPCGQQISFSSRRSQYALACRASCGWKSTSPGGKSGRQRGCHEAQCGTPDSITAAFQTFKVTNEAQPKRS